MFDRTATLVICTENGICRAEKSYKPGSGGGGLQRRLKKGVIKAAHTHVPQACKYLPGVNILSHVDVYSGLFHLKLWQRLMVSLPLGEWTQGHNHILSHEMIYSKFLRKQTTEFNWIHKTAPHHLVVWCFITDFLGKNFWIWLDTENYTSPSSRVMFYYRFLRKKLLNLIRFRKLHLTI